MSVKIVFILCYGIALVVSECVLKFPTNRENTPHYQKYFGTKLIQVPYTEWGAVLQQGENITGYCANTFSDFSYTIYGNPEYDYEYHKCFTFEKEIKFFMGLKTVSLYCDNEQIQHSDGYSLKDTVLNCVDLAWGMYESVTSFGWCQPTLGSYILASKYVGGAVDILAAACFDVNRMSLQTLNYRIGPIKQAQNGSDLYILIPIGLDGAKLGAEVKYFNNTFKHLENSLQSNNINRQTFWSTLANYEYQSIVQGSTYTKYFSKFDSLLNTVWWPNLAAGNWKRFMEALDERSKNVTYNIFVGTSGVVKVSNKNNATQPNLEELQLGPNNITVPAYIWTYLKATDKSEEFVFIGYNAPNYDFFTEEDIIFCEDICGQIDWLDNVRSTFRYSALGVTFCCSVNSSKTLDGFPVVVSTFTSRTSHLTVFDGVDVFTA